MRGRRIDQPGVPQCAGQVEIVGCVLAGCDTYPLPIDILNLPQRRRGRDDVGALDEDIRSGKGEICCASWIDGEEAHVAGPRLQGGKGPSGSLERDKVDRHAEPPPEFASEVDGDPAWLTRGWIALREHRVAEVDGCAQAACRGELLNGSSRHGFHDRSPCMTVSSVESIFIATGFTLLLPPALPLLYLRSSGRNTS